MKAQKYFCQWKKLIKMHVKNWILIYCSDSNVVYLRVTNVEIPWMSLKITTQQGFNVNNFNKHAHIHLSTPERWKLVKFKEVELFNKLIFPIWRINECLKNVIICFLINFLKKFLATAKTNWLTKKTDLVDEKLTFLKGFKKHVTVLYFYQFLRRFNWKMRFLNKFKKKPKNLIYLKRPYSLFFLNFLNVSLSLNINFK